MHVSSGLQLKRRCGLRSSLRGRGDSVPNSPADGETFAKTDNSSVQCPDDGSLSDLVSREQHPSGLHVFLQSWIPKRQYTSGQRPPDDPRHSSWINGSRHKARRDGISDEGEAGRSYEGVGDVAPYSSRNSEGKPGQGRFV